MKRNITPHCSNCSHAAGMCIEHIERQGEPCQHYETLIDNSDFFAHMFTTKGRINRVQFLVYNVLAVFVFYGFPVLVSAILAALGVQLPELNTLEVYLLGIALLAPACYLLTVAAIKRCHDSYTSPWWGYVPVASLLFGRFSIFLSAIAFFYLVCQKGEPEPTAYGTEPCKPYDQQLESARQNYFEPDTTVELA